jgi:hypothetical protein
VVLVVVALLGLTLTGCDSGESAAGTTATGHASTGHTDRPSTGPTGHPTASGPAGGPARDARHARHVLAHLVVSPRPVGTRGYDRDAFGRDWIDTDGNGCNQRDDVLLRDAMPGTATIAPQGSCDHDVLAGTWQDPYTGRTLSFTDLKDLSEAEAIQIDHVVPLAEAWVSGARQWGTAERETFANDPRELLAVDGPTNMSKGDGDPATWRPRRGYQCAYARRWITVKARYGLAVDPSEKAALGELLGACR